MRPLTIILSVGMSAFSACGYTSLLNLGSVDGGVRFSSENGESRRWSQTVSGLDVFPIALLRAGDDIVAAAPPATFDGGAPILLRHHDDQWLKVPIPDVGSAHIDAVAASNSNNVWCFVSNNSFPNETRATRFDGADWEQYPTALNGHFNHAWATAADNIWTVGRQGVLAQYDGQNWLVHSEGPHLHFVNVWSSGKDNVWVTGYETFARPIGTERKHALFHYDGVKWIRWAVPGDPNELGAMWGSAPNDVWVGQSIVVVDSQEPRQWFEGSRDLFHFNGTEWSKITGPPIIPGAFTGSSGSDVWMVGIGLPATPYGFGLSKMAHFNGKTWSEIAMPDGIGRQLLTGVVMTSMSVLWVSGYDPSDSASGGVLLKYQE